MKMTNRLVKFAGTATFMKLLALLNVRAAEPPQPPPLPPLPPLRTTPALRPVPLRTGLATNRLSPAAVPANPVPLFRLGPQNLAISASTSAGASRTPVTNPGALVYDAEQKEYSAKPGEIAAAFTFYLTNVSSSEVIVNRVNTSCGCTVAKLPQQPWHVAAGTNGPINVTVDLRGKSGTLMKTVTVDSTAGAKSLLVRIAIPPQPILSGLSTNNMNRNRNLERAKADPQAIFKSDCVECHVKPAVGKVGKDLYAGACSVCHDAQHRASMVPDLHLLKHPDTREYWMQIVTEGKPNSLMPGFAQQKGGILTSHQILSLVDYFMTDFPKDTNTGPRSAIGRLKTVPAVTIPSPNLDPQTNAARTSAAILGPPNPGLFSLK